MKVTAAIARMEIKARMSAYSASPCPASLRIFRSMWLSVTFFAPPTLYTSNDVQRISPAEGGTDIGIRYLAVYLVGDDRENVIDLRAEECQRYQRDDDDQRNDQ